jgi:hypothetical protein
MIAARRKADAPAPLPKFTGTAAELIAASKKAKSN